jgi:hypothetical protein
VQTVDKYVKYEDYYKTNFPFLLLETWEEISKAYRENVHSKKEKTYGSIPIWFKSFDREETKLGTIIIQSNYIYSFSLIIKYLCFFLLSAIIESNQKINFEEDILRLKLDYIDTKTNSNKNDFFGIVQKAIKLKEDDSRVMEVVKTNLKTLSTSQNVPSYSSSFTTKDEYYKNQFQIYEFYISVKFRRYIDTKQLPIDYEVKHFLD